MSTLKRAIEQRYEIDLPLRYRRVGECDWRTGRTVNASRMGVLFQADDGAYDEGTPVELELHLPGPTRTTQVRCTGSVVRCECPPTGHVRIAATIDAYRFETEESVRAVELPTV